MTTPFLIVLRAADMEKSRQFHEAMGLRFVEEQHGNGPKHWACEASSFVIEIYPGEGTAFITPKQSGATMLGFHVESLDDTLSLLRPLNIQVKGEPKDAPWGRWVNVVDPDGHVVQLVEKPKETDL